MQRCFRIVYEPAGRASQCPAGRTLLEDAAHLGLLLRSDCGGHGTCGHCRIIVTSLFDQPLPEPTENERQLLTDEELQAGYRLACCCYPAGDLRITIPAESIDSQESGSKDQLDYEIVPDPLVMRQIIDSHGTSPTDKDLVALASDSQTPRGWNQAISFSAIRHLASVYDQNPLTLVRHRKFGLTAILAGKHRCSLGLAFDIGTTTLAAYLCDFSDGRILAAASAANPQRRHGEDVVSRIAYAMEHDSGTRTLQTLVIDGLNQLSNTCLSEAGFDAEFVDEVCLVGNPTMQHLCLGINPRSLGSYPYLPACRQSLDICCADIGLSLRRDVNVHVFPVVSGFVGGDTVAAVLADGTHKRSEVTLLIDIGTNGELVLGNSEGLWSTSCATGPALEGAHISCGMRAISGAIDTVVIDPVSYKPKIHIIGNDGVTPLGLCGSGIIDTVAAMVKTGLILPSGRLREGLPGVVIDENGIGQGFVLYRPASGSNGRQVILTLLDIRQVQLAKAALSTGIELLMKHSGHTQFDRLVLTGAFGAHFNWNNAASIGMIPDIPDTVRVEIIKNGAGHGAVNALLNRASRTSKDYFASLIRVVELSEDPDFTTLFTLATGFPGPPASQSPAPPKKTA